jgi:hypothetical protein
MPDFYESLPFLGPMAQWFAKAREHAKKLTKESGQQYVKYEGYILVNDHSEFIGYAFVNEAFLVSPDENKLYLARLEQQLADVKAFEVKYGNNRDTHVGVEH